MLKEVDVATLLLTAQVCKDVYLKRVTFLPKYSSDFTDYHIVYTLQEYFGIPKNSLVHLALSPTKPSTAILTYIPYSDDASLDFWRKSSAEVTIVNLFA